MHFAAKITAWYDLNKRPLPWRETHDAYKIWISEIILQQTRVEQGTNYYFRFLEKFPDVFKLAGSHQDAVMKLWQGLGYYSRAINMHTAAKQICTDFNGKIPDTFEDILKIKGIGLYTASAVLSIAYNKPYPVADGNVKRFISRYCGFAETLNSTTLYNKIQKFLKKEIAGTSARLFNQAIMEFGALYCKKSKPECRHCIFLNDCFAFKNQIVDKLPNTIKKNTVKERFFIYLDIREKQENGHYVFIRKRDADDIWRNLYEFHLIEVDNSKILHSPESLTEFINIFSGVKIERFKKAGVFDHKLTHQLIHAVFYNIIIVGKPNLSKMFMKTHENLLEKYPVSRLTEKYLKSGTDSIF